MEFNYSFTVNTRVSVSGTVKLPLKNNMVQFGQFRPDEILDKHIDYPLYGGLNHHESAEEFRSDCDFIITQVNAVISSLDLYTSFNRALKIIVENHIKRFGRIFVNDLMAYIDVYSELLLALGFNRKILADIYPTILYILIQMYKNYVLEAFNTFDGKNISFVDSPRYDNLREYVTVTYVLHESWGNPFPDNEFR